MSTSAFILVLLWYRPVEPRACLSHATPRAPSIRLHSLLKVNWSNKFVFDVPSSLASRSVNSPSGVCCLDGVHSSGLLTILCRLAWFQFLNCDRCYQRPPHAYVLWRLSEWFVEILSFLLPQQARWLPERQVFCEWRWLLCLLLLLPRRAS